MIKKQIINLKTNSKIKILITRMLYIRKQEVLCSCIFYHQGKKLINQNIFKLKNYVII
jgi:hypothetical protein